MKFVKGFTLIELMIAVAIIGVISAIAIPQYKQYVVRGNRAAAQAFMMDVANREKQYLLDARSYTSNWAFAPPPTPNLAMTAPTTVSNNYTITICLDAACSPALSPPSFKITATPIVGKPQVSDGLLTLDDAGNKTPSANW